MILPMMGFLFALMGVGGIISLAAVVDPHHRRAAPYIGFTLFFAGLIAFCLSMGLGLILEMEMGLKMPGGVAFFGGYVLGGLGGALLGLFLASRHKRHLIKGTSDDAIHHENESGSTDY